jgi:hypothetical protein
LNPQGDPLTGRCYQPGPRPCPAEVLALLAVLLAAAAPLFAGPTPDSTQYLNGDLVDQRGDPIPGVPCTLTAPILPQEGLSVTSDEKGHFSFPGLAPGTYSLTCASLGFQLLSKTGIEIRETPPPVLKLTMYPEVVHQQVQVRAQAPSAAEQGATPPEQLTANQLRALPLVEQKFKAALPVTPGVVRTPDGKINIKGEVESQGLLLVDSAEMVDPVTGAFSIEIPIDAVQTVSVYKTTDLADYGRFSGGLTTLVTKPPAARFEYQLNDFVPDPRIRSGHIVGIQADEPRLYVTGPLISNKLNFSEAFEYIYNNQPVRGLAWPNNEIKTQGFNSFSNFQYIRSDRQVVTANLDFFPLRRQFANINSLVPQTASSNYGQQGFTTGVTDRYLFASGAILTSLFQYMDFNSNAYGQGPEDMLVTPTGWGGNFFNTYTRNSNQEELGETYQFAKKEWHGKHEVKTGVEAHRRSYLGTSESHPVTIQTVTGLPAETINFSGPARLRATDTEVATFGEDAWSLRDNLTVNYGLRYSYQTVGEPAAFAPRTGVVYSPGSSGRTIIRGGLGVFYDRVPLLAGDFTQNPERIVTYFNSEGLPTGSPITFQNAYIRVNENGQQIVPSHNRLDSAPHNLSWNLEADRQFSPKALLRVSYLFSRTYQQFTINPLDQPGTTPTLLLTNTGASRYNEFDTTLRVRASANADMSFAYVHSQARGDLNTLSAIYTPFEAPVIVPNLFGTLPSNVPNRFITWGDFKLPRDWGISPVFDVHTGLPYSTIDVYQNYVGVPNSFRFPTFASVDLKVTKDLTLGFLPGARHHKFRVGMAIFNLTNHSNPRDVYNNVTSPYFRHFVGFQHQFYGASFDILY